MRYQLCLLAVATFIVGCAQMPGGTSNRQMFDGTQVTSSYEADGSIRSALEKDGNAIGDVTWPSDGAAATATFHGSSTAIQGTTPATLNDAGELAYHLWRVYFSAPPPANQPRGVAIQAELACDWNILFGDFSYSCGCGCTTSCYSAVIVNTDCSTLLSYSCGDSYQPVWCAD